MAVTALNDYAIGDVNFNTMMTSLDKAFKGKAEITISEYDTDSAPDVKVGSVFENNGSLFIVEGTDITPTGYSGISDSTTFYLYYDESAEEFIYSETAPIWNDALQGWYNGNDRAFFSMYKDSGGTLYENKALLMSQNNFEVANDLIVNGSIHGSCNYSEIGTIIIAGSTDLLGTTEYLPGTTVQGSSLVRSTSTNGSPFNGEGGNVYYGVSIYSGRMVTLGLVGIWRLQTRVYVSGSTVYPLGLFQRIS